MRLVLCSLTVLCTVVCVVRGFCHANCLCKQDILAVNCSQAGLSSIPILLNPRIRSLTLANNFISEVTADELSLYAELEYLDLSHNRIKAIAANAFSKLHKLKWLKLNSNQLANIGPETFAGLNAIKVLHMDGNKLARLPTAVFSDMGHMQVLNLSSNVLESIAPSAFSGLSELKELHLQDNHLTDIGEQPFRHFPALRLLDLSCNSITQVPAYSFASMSDLEVLNLADNRIAKIGEHAFSGLQNVRHLHLDANELHRIPTLSFRPLSDLDSLTIGRNPFEEISTSAFEGLTRLRQLVITECPLLKAVGLNGFSGLFHLETLILAENPVFAEFHPLSFETDAPLALQQVYLFSNNLTYLPKNLLPWKQLNELDLRNNPWHCDCGMRWIGGILSQALAGKEGQSEASAANGLCESPAELKGTPLLDLQQDGLLCSDDFVDIPCIVSLLLTTIFILCTVILILAIRYRRRLCIQSLFQSDKQRTLGFYEHTLIAPSSDYEKAHKDAALLYGIFPTERSSAALSQMPFELRYGNHYYTGDRSFGDATLWKLSLPPPPPPPIAAPCLFEDPSVRLPYRYSTATRL